MKTIKDLPQWAIVLVFVPFVLTYGWQQQRISLLTKIIQIFRSKW